MANTLLGDDDFTFEDIKNLFHGILSQSAIKASWQEFSLYLGTPEPMQDCISNYFFLDDSNRLDAILTMLIDWRLRKSNEATIKALLDIMKQIKQWELLNDHIQKLIIKKAKTWDDLDENSKEKALNYNVLYHGKVQSLSLIQESLTCDEFQELFSRQITQSFFRQMLRGSIVNLDELIRESKLNERSTILNHENAPQAISHLSDEIPSRSISFDEQQIGSCTQTPTGLVEITKQRFVLNPKGELVKTSTQNPKPPFNPSIEASDVSIQYTNPLIPDSNMEPLIGLTAFIESPTVTNLGIDPTKDLFPNSDISPGLNSKDEFPQVPLSSAQTLASSHRNMAASIEPLPNSSTSSNPNPYTKLSTQISTPETDILPDFSFDAETSPDFRPERILCSDIRLGTGSADTNVFEGTFGSRKVAVKVLSNFRDQELAQNEIKLLVQCDKHDNIVRYIHSEKTPYGFLIALELCEKSTLADWVDDSTCFGIQVDPMDVLRQTTQGLGFLHHQKPNIIHRDLKPSNILFLIRGNEVVVKISDFGISRSLTPGRNTRTVTRFGGTSGWTAAEMLMAESILNRSRRSQAAVEMPKMTKKTDIFSLGCIYYFVLTNGEHPFGDNERLRDYKIETDANVLKTTPPEQYDLRLRCNMPLLENMLAKDPNVRPNVEYMLAHPIFWTHKKMLDFIDEVSNFVNKPTPENKDICAICIDKLERNYFPKISNGSPDGWFDSLDTVLKPLFMQRYKNKDNKDKAIMLVRTLRNFKHHYHEMNFEPDVKKHIGEIPNDFMVYWLTTFPSLINEMRDAFVDLQDKTNFKEYF